MIRRKISDKDVLSKSIQRRYKYAMVRILDEYDQKHNSSDAGELFKINIKHLLNDMIRCTDSEISDYNIIYSPVKFNNDNTLSVTRTFLETLNDINFSSDEVIFKSKIEKRNVMQSLRDLLGAGILYQSDDSCFYVIKGVSDCVNFAVPFLDKYRLNKQVNIEYKNWRDNLVKNYLGR